MTFSGGNSDQGLTYIATADNSAYLGEASKYNIVVHIANTEGPRGTNSDYIIELANSLHKMGVTDPHVFAIVRHLKQISNG
jgi:cation transport protein ChaC